MRCLSISVSGALLGRIKAEKGRVRISAFPRLLTIKNLRNLGSLGILRSLGFEEVNGKMYFFRDDDDAFKFFKYEIEKIQKYGEVFYSERGLIEFVELLGGKSS